MKKSALLRSVAASTGVPYGTVKRVMDEALDEIIERLHQGDRVVLSGFGTFALRPYKARTWVNPQTNRPVDIPAALRPGFVTSAALKRRLADAPLTAPAAIGGAATNGSSAARPARRRSATGTPRSPRAKTAAAEAPKPRRPRTRNEG
jgi:DNA-binding protein HU-beta